MSHGRRERLVIQQLATVGGVMHNKEGLHEDLFNRRLTPTP